jgi:hypothetical protein
MKLNYKEGTVFSVPLSQGFATGVVARMAPKGKIVLGYFYGPRMASSVKLDDFIPGVDNCVLCCRFGDLGLIKGYWPIIGEMTGWQRSAWPMPDFIRRDLLGRLRPVRVQYADDDPGLVIAETVADDDVGLPEDGLAGYGFVEATLDRLLA